MSEKKVSHMESPNVSIMQPVWICSRTTIYIAHGADPVLAKKRFLDKVNHKKTTTGK